MASFLPHKSRLYSQFLAGELSPAPWKRSPESPTFTLTGTVFDGAGRPCSAVALYIPARQTSENHEATIDHHGIYVLSGVYANGETYLLTLQSGRGNVLKITFTSPCSTCIADGATVQFDIGSNFFIPSMINTELSVNTNGMQLGSPSGAINVVRSMGFTFHSLSYAHASIVVSLCSAVKDTVCSPVI